MIARVPGGALPAISRRDAATAALAATPLLAFASLWAASNQDSGLSAALVAFAPLVVILAAVRPDVAATLIPALIMGNAGVVLSDRLGGLNVLSLALAFVGVALVCRSPWRRAMLRLTPVLLAFGVFAAMRVLSVLQAGEEYSSVRTVGRDLVLGAAIILVVSSVASSRHGLRRCAEVVVAAAGALALATVLNRIGFGGGWLGFAEADPISAEQQRLAVRSPVVIAPDGARQAGPLADANFWAQALLLVLPLALWAARTGGTRLIRICAGASALFIAAAIAVTQSRGGALAMALVLGIWLWWQGGRYRLAVLALPVIVIFAVVATGSAERFQELRQIDDARSAEGLRGRLSENLAAVEMWKDHPILGVGANGFPARYREYAAEIGLDPRSERHAHNSYLQMAAESGVLGFLAFVALAATALGATLRTRARLLRQGEAASGRLTEALFAGLVGYLFAAVFLHQGFPDYLWLWLGLISGAILFASANARSATAAPDAVTGPSSWRPRRP